MSLIVNISMWLVLNKMTNDLLSYNANVLWITTNEVDIGIENLVKPQIKLQNGGNISRKYKNVVFFFYKSINVHK
jgi:hypothetical protein